MTTAAASGAAISAPTEGAPAQQAVSTTPAAGEVPLRVETIAPTADRTSPEPRSATPADPHLTKKRRLRAWRRRRRSKKRRGLPGQRRAREREREARRQALARAEALREVGLGAQQVAEILGLSPRTQRRWALLEQGGEHLPEALGRSAARSPREVRMAALSDLERSPRTSVRALMKRHSRLGRREAEELVGRFRSLCTTRHRREIQTLTWHVPGAVWAVDFSDAGLLIDGTYPHLLLVRDLASGYELLTLPCRDQEAETVRAALTALIVAEGPPLVIKSDNGGGFIAGTIQDLLAAHGTLLLRNPPGTPSYNGSREAAGGWVKTRAHHIAATHGRETCWSCADVEAARLEANEAPRDRGPTPGELWSAREAISPELRQALGETVRGRVVAGLAERGLVLGAVVEEDVEQEVARAAIAGALRERGLLSSRTTSIPARRGPRRTDKRAGKPEEVSSSM